MREIKFRGKRKDKTYDTLCLLKLFDLIEAKLVEKVEDK